jgi:hypothetical protein
MTLSLATARTNLRARLNEVSAAHWSDAQLDTWLNEACAEIASRTECLFATATPAVTAHVATVANAPVDMLRIHHVSFAPTGESQIIPLIYLDLHAMDRVWGNQLSGENYPEFYTIWGLPPSSTIRLYPTPHLAGTLNVSYFKQATPAGTNLDVVDGWSHYVYDYAEYRAFLRARDQRWQQALERHERNIATIIDMTRRATDQPGAIIDQQVGRGDWFNNLVIGW